MKVVCVEIQINTVAEQGMKGMSFELLFSHQPTVQDIIDAYDNTSALYKRDDHKEYRIKLVEGLRTYGVPQLDQLHITDGENGRYVKHSMLRCDWYLNLESADRSVANFPYGNIVVTEREVNFNSPTPAPAVRAAVKPKKKGKE